MISVSDIQRLIDNDTASEKKRFAAVGQRYYEANHDIMKCRFFYTNADGKLVEDTARANIKISHPFFTLLADQLPAYMLSFDDNPIRAKENVEGLQEHLDTYFDNEFWAEYGDYILDTYVKGFGYMYAYKNADNRMAFQCADSMGVVEVRETDTDEHCKYIIYWYIDRIEKGKKEVKRIQVWSDKETTYFVQDGTTGEIRLDDSAEINPRPHVVYKDPKTGKRMGYGLGFIPFWRLDNNKKQFSGLKPIKGIIDDYDMHACSLSNNLVDFDTPLHVVSGYQGDNLDELQQNLKTKKIVGVDSEGGVEIRTVNVPYQARKEKLDIDERNIYIFGMGFNPAQVGDGNITNVVIQSRYTLLDLKAAKMQKRSNKVLEQFVKIVLAEINQEHDKDYQLSDIYFDFPHNIMTNKTENVQNALVEAQIRQCEVNTVLNVAANVGDEQTLKAICEIMEWDYDELQREAAKLSEEQNTVDAQSLLEGVTPEDDEGGDISDDERQTQEAVLSMLDELMGDLS